MKYWVILLVIARICTISAHAAAGGGSIILSKDCNHEKPILTDVNNTGITTCEQKGSAFKTCPVNLNAMGSKDYISLDDFKNADIKNQGESKRYKQKVCD